VFNATFSNISVISWPPVLVVEEAGVPGENQMIKQCKLHIISIISLGLGLLLHFFVFDQSD
jgi:hypothetical protein